MIFATLRQDFSNDAFHVDMTLADSQNVTMHGRRNR